MVKSECYEYFLISIGRLLKNGPQSRRNLKFGFCWNAASEWSSPVGQGYFETSLAAKADHFNLIKKSPQSEQSNGKTDRTLLEETKPYCGLESMEATICIRTTSISVRFQSDSCPISRFQTADSGSHNRQWALRGDSRNGPKVVIRLTGPIGRNQLSCLFG